MGTGQSREDIDEKKTKKEEKVDAVREFVTDDEEMEKEEGEKGKEGERERDSSRNGRGML